MVIAIVVGSLLHTSSLLQPNHLKHIVARGKIGISSFAGGACINPIFIKSFEDVLESVLGWIGMIQHAEPEGYHLLFGTEGEFLAVFYGNLDSREALPWVKSTGLLIIRNSLMMTLLGWAAV
jgi:hypothetical protein